MKLGLFTVREGGVYSGENRLEVDFGKGKIATLGGDNGVGKTTGLECFKIVVAAIGGDKALKDLANVFSGKLDIEQRFQGNDRKWYIAKQTKSKFYVREENSKEDIEEPKTFVKSHLGRVAADPMAYKNSDVNKFVKWLAGMTDMGEEGYEKEYNALKDAVREYENARAAANKEAKARRTMLSESGYVNESGDLVERVWVAAEKKYAKQLNIKALSEKLDEVGRRSDKLLQAETKLKELETQEQELLAKLAEVQSAIAKGEKYVEENKGAKKEYEAVKTEYDNAAQFAVEYEAFQTAKRYRDEMYEYEQIALTADAAVQTAEQKKKELQWQVIPDIRNAEIVIEGTPEKPAGFYVDGFNIRQQSDTQYLTSIVKILRKLGVKIIILDNLATFGSDFIELIAKLSKEGMYFLLSEMRRGSELTIEYAG